MNERAYDSPLRDAQAAATRERIIEAVVDLLVSEHPGTLSMPTVAERAGVSVGTVYHHFGSKEGLFEAVNEAVDARVTPEHGIRYEHLEEDLVRFWTLVERESAYFRARDASPAGREVSRKRLPRRRQQARRILAEACADELPPAKVERLAALLNALVSSGAFFRLREFGLSVEEAAETAAFAIKTIVEQARQEARHG